MNKPHVLIKGIAAGAVITTCSLFVLSPVLAQGTNYAPDPTKPKVTQTEAPSQNQYKPTITAVPTRTQNVPSITVTARPQLIPTGRPTSGQPELTPAKTPQDRCNKATARLETLTSTLNTNLQKINSKTGSLSTGINTLITKAQTLNLDTVKIQAVQSDLTELNRVLSEIRNNTGVTLQAVSKAKEVQCASTTINAASKKEFASVFAEIGKSYGELKRTQTTELKDVLTKLREDLRSLFQQSTGESEIEGSSRPTTTPTRSDSGRRPTSTPVN